MEQQLENGKALGANLVGQPFSSAYPDQGLMIREPDFILPDDYKEKSITLPRYTNNPKYGEDHTFLNYTFSDTLEDLPDMIAVTNHFLLPAMRPFQWAPLVSFVWKSYWPSTEWRYRTMVELLLQRATGGNALDWQTAWDTIDFLNPTTEHGSFFNGPDTSQPVGGHVVLMDGENLTLMALYGYYNHPWVEVSLQDFLP